MYIFVSLLITASVCILFRLLYLYCCLNILYVSVKNLSNLISLFFYRHPFFSLSIYIYASVYTYTRASISLSLFLSLLLCTTSSSSPFSSFLLLVLPLHHLILPSFFTSSLTSVQFRASFLSIFHHFLLFLLPPAPIFHLHCHSPSFSHLSSSSSSVIPFSIIQVSFRFIVSF